MEYPKWLTIHVMQEDIDLGNPNDAGSCPIAQALMREHGWQSPAVFDYGIEDWLPYQERTEPQASYSPTEKAINFMKLFDGGRVVYPDTFRIRRNDV